MSPPLQGDSNPNPEMQDLSGKGNKEGGLTSPIGKEASGKASKDGTLPSGQGAGQAPNYENGQDPRNVVGQQSSKGNVHQEEVEEVEQDEVLQEDEVSPDVEEVIENEEVLEEEQEVVEEETETESDEALFQEDLNTLFADEEHLSEEFKSKAADIFEAVVVSRVAAEIEEIEADLVEQYNKDLEETKAELIANIDKYLSYVTENWMSENELAIENGLRNEITESFIGSLKDVFAEHYIDVPEEKYDVLSEMQKRIDELEGELNEAVDIAVNINDEHELLQKTRVFENVTKELAQTEVEKFATLVEDISFGSEELYAEKLNVVMENYFPKNNVADDSDKLEDSVENDAIETNTVMSKYASAISKSAKF
jgi:AcrR family transcriptional regulator